MLDRRSGALLMIEIAEGAWSAGLARMLQGFQPAGLLIRELISAEKTLEACRESTHALDGPPLLAINEEGGGALRTILPALPGVMSLDVKFAGEAADLIGRAMAALGLNMNLAPTVDVDISRGAGSASGPAEIAQGAEAFVDAVSSHRVLCCGRHFPGLTTQKANTQGSKAIVIDRSLAALWQGELVPYRKLGNKLAAVEVSHAVHRAYDYEFLRPASLSTGVIEGLLRAKLGYRGLALANASLAAESAGIELGEATVRALAAGCDLVLVPGDEKALSNACEAIARAVNSGKLPVARMNEALARLKAAQKRLPHPPKRIKAAEFSRIEKEFGAFVQV